MTDDRHKDTHGFLMGQLVAQVAELNNRLGHFSATCERLDKRLDDNDRRVDRIDTKVEDMGPHVESWVQCRSKIAGAAVVLSGISAAGAFAIDRVGQAALKLIGSGQ